MERILIVDTSSILHIVKHSEIKRVKPNFKSVYIIYGFLLRLKFYINKTKPTIVAFAMDDYTNNLLRKKIYPEYKANRSSNKKTKEQLELDAIAMPQFKLIEDSVLKEIGFTNTIKLDGYEADDVVGSICKNHPNDEIIIISTDSDLYQLITNSVCILNPRNDRYYTKNSFMKDFDGLEPKMYKRIKVWVGCSTDNVKGLSGIGEKTAIKYLKGELPATSAKHKIFETEEGKEIIKRNKSLIILPFWSTPMIRLKKNNEITKDKILSVAKKYEFTSMYGDADSWVKGFRLGHR